MSVIDFNDATCRRLRGYLDSYLCEELLVETCHDVERHVASCTPCREELSQREALRERLQAAAAAERPRTNLEAAVRAKLDAEGGSRRWGRLWLIAAAAAAVVLGGGWGVSLHLHGIAPHEFLVAEWKIRALLDDVGQVAGLGLGDHVHCTLYRRYDQAEITLDEAVTEIRPDDAELARVVRAALPSEYRLRLSHRCPYRGREFLHFALTGEGGELISVLFTEREEGERIAGVIEASRAGAFEIAVFEDGVFEDGGRWVFVVSDLERTTHRMLAGRLRDSLGAADTVDGPAG